MKKVARHNDIVQMTSGDNINNSYGITAEDLRDSMANFEDVAKSEALALEPSPEKSWKNADIEKWLDEHEVDYDDEDTKAVMLEKVEAYLKKQ